MFARNLISYGHAFIAGTHAILLQPLEPSLTDSHWSNSMTSGLPVSWKHASNWPCQDSSDTIASGENWLGSPVINLRRAQTSCNKGSVCYSVTDAWTYVGTSHWNQPVGYCCIQLGEYVNDRYSCIWAGTDEPRCDQRSNYSTPVGFLNHVWVLQK